ncbi:hypothetical protein AALA98_18005 [Lachnospiraceae bacterium 45-W7]
MARREVKHFKALYFDLCVKDLEKYYSAVSPRGAYRKIQDYLLQRQFSHEQYSGYHSQYKTTDLEIFDLVYEMNKEFPWLRFCLNHFEVTNIGANHDLMQLFDEPFQEPKKV